MIRKPRSDSPLRMLSSEKQAKVIDWMRSGGTGDVRGQVLSEFGFRPSETALSNFWRWWHMQQQFKRATEDSETMMNLLQQVQPELSERKLFDYGQRVFQLKAVQAEDPKTWVNIERLGLDRQQLYFDREKWEFDASAACLKKLPELKLIADDKGLNEDAKLLAVRERLFGVTPE